MSSHINLDYRIDAVIFDLGGVLLDWDPRHLYRKLFSDNDAMERFLREVCTSEWHEPHDRGVPTVASCEELARRYPQWADMIWAWADRGEEMIAGPIEATVDILSELKSSGMRCYALTNMEAETYPLRLERFEFLSWFDGTVVSGFEKIAKPDSEIFVRLLERFGLVATNTLMIDDRPENLESAQRLGLVPLLFRSPGQLRVQLESMSLLSNHS